MLHFKNNLRSILSKLHDYQRYVNLNRSFIHELEEEGCDTKDLRKDLARMEAKIRELQLKCGYPH
jgi:hypothetical protein